MVIAKLKRSAAHVLCGPWKRRMLFPNASLTQIEQAVAASERQHGAQLRVVIDDSLDFRHIWRGVTPRARAIDLFSELRLWDTEQNCAVLLYVLLADRAVEIIADRGINALIPPNEWNAICGAIAGECAAGRFLDGVLAGVKQITAHLAAHFPRAADQQNELPDRPAEV